MALDKMQLKRLLDNPAMFTAQDMGLDEDGESLAPDESSPSLMALAGGEDMPDESMPDESMPDMAEPKMEEPEMSMPDESEPDQSMPDMSEPKMEMPDMKSASVDPSILQKLKRLKAGEPMDDSSQEEIQDVASDMEAPMDLRKKALQKIKQKYLGQ